MYQLFVDTLSDFTPKDCEEFGAKLISVPYAIDGKGYYPFESEDELGEEEFLDLVRKGAKLSTFAVPTEKYIQYFEPIFAAGQDVLYVHFTNQASSAYNACRLAVQELLEKYPERKYYDFDTKAIAFGAFNIALQACKAYKEGKSPEEIIELLNGCVDNYAAYFFCEDLKYFARSGRFNGFTMALASILGIKPMVQCAQDGRLVISHKPKGRASAINLMFDLIDKLGVDVANYDVCFGHISDEEALKEVMDRFFAKYGKEISYRVTNVTRTAVCHAGSLAVGVSFHAKSR